jgi:hypothetical protein
VVVVTGAGRVLRRRELREWADHYASRPSTEVVRRLRTCDRLREIGVADARADQPDRRGRRQTAADGLRPRGDGGRRFIRHAGQRSVPAGGATQWLTIMVGDRRAREIVLMCEEIPAAKAADWGLVNWAVPAAELDAKVDAVVENLARKLPQTTRYAKQHLNFWRDLAWHETINHARDWLALSMATDEPKAAIRRFLEKKSE